MNTAVSFGSKYLDLTLLTELSQIINYEKETIYMNHKIGALAVNTIRTLSIDATNRANSGHPGLPMGAAGNGMSLHGGVKPF